MSVEASAWAWKQSVPPYPKFVLLALADWYNELESCAWPSHAKLSEKVGISRRSVQRSLQWLKDNQLVVPEARFKNNKQISNRYRLPIGVIYIQGCHSDHPRGVTVARGGCHSDAPIEDTITDTIIDTINGGEPQEDHLSTVSDVTKQKLKRKSKEVIFNQYQATPKGCANHWRDCRASAGGNGYSAELIVHEYTMLNRARKRIGDIFPETVWAVMTHWLAFTKHAQVTAGAFNCPKAPNVAFFVKFVEAAADFTAIEQAPEDEGFVQLPAKTTKPLTKPNKIVENTSTAATLEEVLAKNKDFM